ncbi:MAG TPA: MliC family protein [Gemmatimonadaceae bacterium]|jgi:membrane-bound inhibitor of C-type lysozyme
MRQLTIVVAAIVVACTFAYRSFSHRAAEHAYACSNGVTVRATFLNNATKLRLPSGSVRLPSVIAASGIRYANDSLEFWEHQGVATISQRDKPLFEDCRPAR